MSAAEELEVAMAEAVATLERTFEAALAEAREAGDKVGQTSMAHFVHEFYADLAFRHGRHPYCLTSFALEISNNALSRADRDEPTTVEATNDRMVAQYDKDIAEARHGAFEEALDCLPSRGSSEGESILALMDKPPPGTGLRDRPPTVGELMAHQGFWLYELDGWAKPLFNHVVVAGVREQVEQVIAEMEYVRSGFIPEARSRMRWRPVTTSLERAPWPESP